MASKARTKNSGAKKATRKRTPKAPKNPQNDTAVSPVTDGFRSERVPDAMPGYETRHVPTA